MLLLSKVFLKSFLRRVWELPTPKNISYIWGFGRLLGILISVQIGSGLILAFYYVRGHRAWESVIELSREIRRGRIFRLIHRNTASFVFLILFIHIMRALLQSSFYLKTVWLRGWGILVTTMAAAFLGYVLPWGQMSFWGATVIINLLRVLPRGKALVIWLWGGFYVSRYTCSFFYALHYLIPFGVVLLALIHLLILHKTGRTIFRGLRLTPALKIKFLHAFTYKDVVNITWVWILWVLILKTPDWSADPINFTPSDLSNSPLHIQPEWYFLHLYAILRSIPSKVGGLVAFFLALLALLTFRFLSSIQSISQLKIYQFLTWRFIRINFILVWLGIQPVEDPYIYIGQILTTGYFSLIIIILTLDIIL